MTEHGILEAVARTDIALCNDWLWLYIVMALTLVVITAIILTDMG